MEPSWVVITLCISHMTDGLDTFSYVYLTLHSEQVYTFQSVYSLKVSVQFSSVAQLWLTLCNPMNHSTPGLPVHHQLPEFTQTHVHRVGDAIYICIYYMHIYILYILKNVVLFQLCFKMSLKGTSWLLRPASLKVKFMHILPDLLLKVFSQDFSRFGTACVFNSFWFGPY